MTHSLVIYLRLLGLLRQPTTVRVLALAIDESEKSVRRHLITLRNCGFSLGEQSLPSTHGCKLWSCADPIAAIKVIMTEIETARPAADAKAAQSPVGSWPKGVSRNKDVVGWDDLRAEVSEYLLKHRSHGEVNASALAKALSTPKRPVLRNAMSRWLNGKATPPPDVQRAVKRWMEARGEK